MWTQAVFMPHRGRGSDSCSSAGSSCLSPWGAQQGSLLLSPDPCSDAARHCKSASAGGTDRSCLFLAPEYILRAPYVVVSTLTTAGLRDWERCHSAWVPPSPVHPPQPHKCLCYYRNWFIFSFCIGLNKKSVWISQPAREKCHWADRGMTLERCLKQRGKTPRSLKSHIYIFLLFSAVIPGHWGTPLILLLMLGFPQQLQGFSSHAYDWLLALINYPEPGEQGSRTRSLNRKDRETPDYDLEMKVFCWLSFQHAVLSSNNFVWVQTSNFFFSPSLV